MAKSKKQNYGASNDIIKFNKVKWRKRLLVAVATEGWVRYEWAHARYGQVTPINWEAQGFDIACYRSNAYSAIGYSIDDAYNLIVKKALEVKVDWLIIIEDDVVVPNDLFIKFGRYMDAKEFPVVSGLYYTKSEPSEPLIFRGRGNGPFRKWKPGQKVFCDGLPMGCLLIHTSILKWFWENTKDVYQTVDGQTIRRVFETPRKLFYDPEKGGYERQEGTQDLYFFDRMIENDVLKKTGWDKVARRKWPLLCDTGILCKHVCRNTGRMY
jgi:hypothetical protein